MRRERVSLVGAGLAGALLAILLARRGFAVSLYERRVDPRQHEPEAGRSINLALAARGIRALEHAGLMDRVRPLTIEMRGRMVHESGRAPALQPYGQRPEEVIYSVGRAALNRLLIEEAAREPAVSLHFGESCVGLAQNGPEGALGGLALSGPGGVRTETAPTATVATDGAGSAVRAALAARGIASVREEPLDHDYKELTVAAARTGFALEPHALHVWPRRGFMLIALPNTDRSFTATLFLPRLGEPSFAALTSPRHVERFFAEHFADVAALLPDLADQFARHPQGRLGTVHCAPWHAGRYLLLGDAAHAIVPFHGQGMNAAFEDCLLLDDLIEQHADWASLCADFERRRRADAEAIAQMAVENYAEMRERVLNARFVRQQLWARELERRHPGRFIPRYAMVMFHPEIGYAEALRRGQVQQQILDELDAAGGSGALDAARADALIAARL
jgi:kynurenine 3-monooxygenase